MFTLSLMPHGSSEPHELHMLIVQVGAEIVGCACVIEMPELKGREKVQGIPLYIQVEKAGV